MTAGDSKLLLVVLSSGKPWKNEWEQIAAERLAGCFHFYWNMLSWCNTFWTCRVIRRIRKILGQRLDEAICPRKNGLLRTAAIHRQVVPLYRHQRSTCSEGQPLRNLPRENGRLLKWESAVWKVIQLSFIGNGICVIGLVGLIWHRFFSADRVELYRLFVVFCFIYLLPMI